MPFKKPCTAHALFPKCLSNRFQGLCLTFSEIWIKFDAVPLLDSLQNRIRSDTHMQIKEHVKSVGPLCRVYTDSQDMLVLSSTVALRNYKIAVQMAASPEKYGYPSYSLESCDTVFTIVDTVSLPRAWHYSPHNKECTDWTTRPLSVGVHYRQRSAVAALLHLPHRMENQFCTILHTGTFCFMRQHKPVTVLHPVPFQAWLKHVISTADIEISNQSWNWSILFCGQHHIKRQMGYPRRHQEKRKG
jgi:hypothetical protein